jgi:tryptophan 2,3-dioxygenase
MIKTADKSAELMEDIHQRYTEMGQDPLVHLEGLKYAKPITYWDYCEIDTLLSLQKPRTIVPDESVFIMYHQVNELIFKMILSEIQQIADKEDLNAHFFTERLGRINRYWGILINSFSIMKDGMETAQYLKFRTTLTPASGFQSAQYRTIEICCTPLENLVHQYFKPQLPENATLDEKLSKIYWQAAGLNFKTGEKSLTLRLFEEKYREEFLRIAHDYEHKNLWLKYMSLNPEEQKDQNLIKALRHLDEMVNIEWVMTHYHTAEKYLESDGNTTEATGGSSWKKYMHPSYQRRIFFPKLWSSEELENWGRN